jgi:hypothetical protein
MVHTVIDIACQKRKSCLHYPTMCAHRCRRWNRRCHPSMRSVSIFHYLIWRFSASFLSLVSLPGAEQEVSLIYVFHCSLFSAYSARRGTGGVTHLGLPSRWDMSPWNRGSHPSRSSLSVAFSTRSLTGCCFFTHLCLTSLW